jgi:hypothetical protein
MGGAHFSIDDVPAKGIIDFGSNAGAGNDRALARALVGSSLVIL